MLCYHQKLQLYLNEFSVECIGFLRSVPQPYDPLMDKYLNVKKLQPVLKFGKGDMAKSSSGTKH